VYLIKAWYQKEEIVEKGIQLNPFGPGFSQEQVEQAERMEVWGSSDACPGMGEGDDYCEFLLFKKNEKFATKRVAGY